MMLILSVHPKQRISYMNTISWRKLSLNRSMLHQKKYELRSQDETQLYVTIQSLVANRDT